MKSKVIILSSFSLSLVNFRLDLIKDLIGMGYEVHCTGPDLNHDVIKILKKYGATYHHISFQRNGFNILSDLKYVMKLRLLFNKIRPNKIISYTIKPVIFSNIANFFLSIDSFSIITGLGFYASPKTKSKEIIKTFKVKQ